MIPPYSVSPSLGMVFREEEDLRGGAVLKGTVEPGKGGASPQEGDLVSRGWPACCSGCACRANSGVVVSSLWLTGTLSSLCLSSGLPALQPDERAP